MQPYSHLNIALQLEKEICPTNRADYYWGAVAPDVRYVAGVPRIQMHFAPQDILAFREKYPHLESFVQGYLVHCQTDLISLRELLEQRIVFRPIAKRAPGQFFPILLEMYSFERKRPNLEFAYQPNEMLRELGIRDPDSDIFGRIISGYLATSSFDAALEVILSLGGEHSNSRVEKYLDEVKKFNRNRLAKPMLFALANLEKLNQQVLEIIRCQPEFQQSVRWSESRG